jgi:hypothetical protein
MNLLFCLLDALIQRKDSLTPLANGISSNNENNTFGIIGIVIGIIGVIGTIYTIVSYINSKKDKHKYQYLLDLAEKNIRKDVTEETIKEKEDTIKQREGDLKSISDKIDELKKKIKEEIPNQARIAVLKDKLNTQTELLIETYNIIIKIKKELKDFSINDFPEEISKAIEKEISPEYLLKEKKSRLKNYITIITTAVAILTTLLPHPFNRYIAIPLFLVLIPILFSFFSLHLPSDAMSRKIMTLRIIFFFFLAFGLVGVFFSIFLFSLSLHDLDSVNQTMFMIIAIISILCLMLSFFYWTKFKMINKKKR